MIQRIQSIYLLLAALATGGTFSNLFDLGKATNNDNSVLMAMMADGHIDILDNNIWTGLTGAAVLVTLLAIFLFKNRNLQINLSRLNILLIIAMIGVFGFMAFPAFQQNVFQFGYDLGLLLLSIVFTVLGMSAIKKDSKLVKSMDRLR